ncbi:MAG: outer membrane protein assembly factor BamD [Candidatus Dadabacteria bacterium]|nr:outer membrane protein assembly factor BamD [Candidatus Dadabacteria bacterium]NIQ13991.1 outer membrane protein assembly factor BamD [Candidatus Dadabacteria bacterium]
MKNYLIIFALFTFLVASCGGKNKIYEDTAENLYEEALKELNKEEGFPWILSGTNYDKLFDLLKEIQLRYTFSHYAILAELRTADTYFKKEEYRQAAVEYLNFINRHPGNIELEHATYQLANSYYKLRRGKDRDPSKPSLAIKWFTHFIELYPHSELVVKAEKKIVKCRNILAEREIYIGNYYKKRNNYKAAIERYKNVLEYYPETRFKDKAINLIEETQQKIASDS